MPASEGIPLWPHQAWIRLEGTATGSVLLAGQLIRIGRHEDNDIRLLDGHVHGYHAVIERTPEEAFIITDLSGKEGYGLRVNGERHARVRLSDGDVIELGHTRMRFERVPL
jgi:pSer/pThr/pTyr-binding forkhead associated (FHA) protein